MFYKNIKNNLIYWNQKVYLKKVYCKLQIKNMSDMLIDYKKTML